MERIIDFSEYKFRCSELGKLMVGVKPALTDKQKELYKTLKAKEKEGKITDRQRMQLGDLIAKMREKPQLSKSVETHLKNKHKAEMFMRNKEIQNKYIDKGLIVEAQAITLYSEVENSPFFKNQEHFSNDFIKGTPDSIKNKVVDIKSSWDFSTFPLYEDEIPNTDYYWQLQGYMALTGLERAELVYCLVDTPEVLIEDEIRRVGWKTGFLEVPEEVEEEIRRNHTYSDIPMEMRVKKYSIDFDPKAIQELYNQIKRCRDYMNSLTNQAIEKLKITV